MHLLPKPQKIHISDGFLKHHTLCVSDSGLEPRLVKALGKLPLSSTGAAMEIGFFCGEKESYTLDISADKVTLQAGGPEGIFYGIQTLRQIFTHKQIPCMRIEDKPDFPYRGFYHDVTRGRVPKLETMKRLVDEMAYYKMNSLQLYVEHTFPFLQTAAVSARTGCLTAEEIRELDQYCWENFIEFIPSMATFGHLYELLQNTEYKSLCALEQYEQQHHFWVERMLHHTIDPLNPKSFPLIQSMIDQYLPLFRSNKFNICCDETFDLGAGIHKGKDTGKLYVDFVNKIVQYLQSKGKTVMMWADILLKHPESIGMLPDNIQYLNWNYGTDIPLESLAVFEKQGKEQIVCPGTQSWAAFCPNIALAETNISRMTELGHQCGAIGVLNTNWGDYGHPCSLGMCMYPMVLGAVKSWSVGTLIDHEFEKSVDCLLFKQENALQLLRRLSECKIFEAWSILTCCYSNSMFDTKLPVKLPEEQTLLQSRRGCREVIDLLSAQQWGHSSYGEEMLIAAEGMLVIAELLLCLSGHCINRTASTRDWLDRYQKKWLDESKESELREIVALFLFAEYHSISR